MNLITEQARCEVSVAVLDSVSDNEEAVSQLAPAQPLCDMEDYSFEVTNNAPDLMGDDPCAVTNNAPDLSGEKF